MKLARLAVAGLGVALTAPAWGQFQDPTKEELQMTADAKAPGAHAVYLSLADDQDGTVSTRTYYERVKILTEKGKERATLRFSHDPSTKYEVEGRTIHKDGVVIPLTDSPTDLVEFKAKDAQTNSLVFTLPSVEVGSILEYRVKFKYNGFAPSPTWFIQQDMFMHHAHYSFKRGTLGSWGASYVARLGGDAKVVDSKGTYTLDLNDVAPLPDEDWMPPLNTFKWRVSFFSTDFRTAQEYWDAAGKVWASFVHDFTNPTGTLKKAAGEMVAPGDSETVKAQKIYAAVMKLENTDFTREKTKVERKKEKIKDIHNAQDVWRDQSGNGDEIALLYVALCRAAGLNVVSMIVVDRSRALFDSSVLNSRQMDDFIAVGQLDGKEVYLDPGEKACPFGVLHWKHSLATGFRLTDKAAAIVTTPSLSYKSSSITRTADLTMDSSGAVEGTIRLVMQGQESIYWRQIALENDEDEVKKRFKEWINGYLPEGVQAEFENFLGLADLDSNLTASVRVNGNLGTVTGKHVFVTGSFFEVKSKHPFVAQDKRTIPVDLHFPRTERDDVTYRLPAGYRAEVDSKPNAVNWPDHAKLTITTSGGTDGVHVVRMLVYNYTILGPDEYGSLHDFYQKVAAADQQQITLTKGAANLGEN
jgi:hypothetical protein